MKFFRNPEISRLARLLLLFSAASTAAGFALSPAAGLLLLLSCALLCGTFFVYTRRRYDALASFSETLDRILHGDDSIFIREYQEGELSILQSEIYKMTVKLNDQAAMLSRDKKYLADSLADISHQLRTPLTSMTLSISLLASPRTDEERRRELLRELLALTSRMDWLITALLKLSKIDSGMAEFRQEPVSVRELIEKASEPLAVPMDLKNQRLQVICDGSEEYLGDLSWSCEALGNILKNCMEHTPSGGVLTVTASQSPMFTELRVEDTGAGFDPQDLPFLFERFYKGKNASSQSVGIGLALARRIVEAQNGTIRAENRREGGACFLIRFEQCPLPPR